MTASVASLSIANKEARERIFEIIRGETLALSDKHQVSITHDGTGDVWEVWITRPNGEKVSRQLSQDQGDLVPAVFRIRFRELVKAL
jgi:hypothetical protein